MDKIDQDEMLEIVLKHMPGKHDQKRHGWRYGGVDQARRSMRGRSAEERTEYRKRAGMPTELQKKPKVEPKKENQGPKGMASTGTKRVIRGTKVDTGEAINRAIKTTKVNSGDMDKARTSLSFMGHKSPSDKMIFDFAYQTSFLNNLQRITGANTSGQVGKWDFSTGDSLLKSFNAYLDRRVAGQRAEWTRRTGGG